MKKVLSLVLALVMVLGMSTMAFAAPTAVLDTADFGGTLTGPTAVDPGEVVTFEEFDITWDTITNAPNGDKVGTLELGTSSGAAENALRTMIQSVSATIVEIAPTTGTVATTVVAGVARLNVKITFKSTITPGTYPGAVLTLSGTSVGSNNVEIDFNSGGNFTVNAVSGPTTGSTDSIPSSVKVSAIASDWTRLVDFNAGDKIDLRDNKTHTEDISTKAPLLGGMFVWEASSDTTINGTSYKKGVEIAAADVTWENTMVRSSHLKDVNVRRTNPVNANTSTIRDYGIDTTYLRIRTVKYFLKCGETDVSFDLDLTFKSKASGDLLPINFTLANAKEWMYDGQDYVDMTDPIYVEADVSLRNVEMYIGENLYLTKSFGSGQKAYAHVDLELSAGDEKLFTQYSELSDVYTLYTVGVSSANVYAEFKDLGDTYFVYDENFKLLGTTADKKLPFSSKYYLTTKKVDMGTSSDPTETPTDNDSSTSVPTDTGAVGTGGGTVAAPSNYNPNTGC